MLVTGQCRSATGHAVSLKRRAWRAGRDMSASKYVVPCRPHGGLRPRRYCGGRSAPHMACSPSYVLCDAGRQSHVYAAAVSSRSDGGLRTSLACFRVAAASRLAGAHTQFAAMRLLLRGARTLMRVHTLAGCPALSLV